MEKKMLDLHDDYRHGLIHRREFLKRLSVLAGSVAAANALLPLFESNHARAAIIPADDPRLATEKVTYPGATGNVQGYFARPKGDAKLPGVIVIHENRGLNPHIEDVARRVAIEGFLALAPDALSPAGGTPPDEQKAVEMINKLDMKATIGNFVAAVKYLKTLPISTGKVGVVGFCWGGEVANQVATNSPDASAVVPYYGKQPASEDVPKIKASLLLQYAGNDERINAGIPAYEEALKKASIDYKLYMYEGTAHGFNNDTSPARYNKAAAELAWKRTMDFFKQKLKR